MRKQYIFLVVILLLLFVAVIIERRRVITTTPAVTQNATYGTDAYWKQHLTTEQYYVLREAGTDIPFTHTDMLHNSQKGTYVTIDCNEPVFRSEDKFDSGTGWPSFTKPISSDAVTLKEDNTLGMQRTEVVGSKCGGHLGHVFDDGPAPTGKRYCINATALKFIPDDPNGKVIN